MSHLVMEWGGTALNAAGGGMEQAPLLVATAWLGWGAWVLCQIVLGWLAADFASGIFHWAEDRYGSPRWPVFGGAIRDTIRHHRRPTGMLKKPVVRRSWRVFLIAAVGFSVFALLGVVNAFTVALIIGAGLANEIHAAAHSGPKENGKLITWLQKTGVIQSHAHHAAHHRGLKNVHYCTVTNWLNPALERVRFWRRLEALIKVVAKERPRRDPVVRRRQRRLWHKSMAEVR
ncbi:MAG: fatty acid desaturase CarF family protein [Pseudomonadota bacterium]